MHMWVKALKSFGGKVSMGQGQEMELEENDTLQDLLEAGYVTKIMVNGQEQPEPDKVQEETTENQNSNAEDSTDQSADEAELQVGYLDEADLEEMTTAELNQFLENIAKLIEATATDVETAAKIVRDSKVKA